MGSHLFVFGQRRRRIRVDVPVSGYCVFLRWIRVLACTGQRNAGNQKQLPWMRRKRQHHPRRQPKRRVARQANIRGQASGKDGRQGRIGSARLATLLESRPIKVINGNAKYFGN